MQLIIKALGMVTTLIGSAIASALASLYLTILATLAQIYSILVIAGNIISVPIHLFLMTKYIWGNNFSFSNDNGPWQDLYNEIIEDDTHCASQSESSFAKLITTLQVPFRTLQLVLGGIISESIVFIETGVYLGAFYLTAAFFIVNNTYKYVAKDKQEHTNNDELKEIGLKFKAEINSQADEAPSPTKTYSNWYTPTNIFRSIYSAHGSFLILRSVRAMVQATYNWHYADKEYSNYSFIANTQKAFDGIKSIFIFLNALLPSAPKSADAHTENTKLLADKFARIREKTQQKNSKENCVYFVSSCHDRGGAIINSEKIRYYHLHKISELEKHYNVMPYVVNDVDSIEKYMKENQNVKLINIVSHGTDVSRLLRNNLAYATSAIGLMSNDHDCFVNIQAPEMEITPKDKKCALYPSFKPIIFNNLAPGGQIILDACSIGAGENSYAENTAKANPGISVYAPEHNLYFSKPVIKCIDNKPNITAVDHGVCLAIPYQMKRFLYQIKS